MITTTVQVLLSAQEAAKFMSIGVSSLWRHARAGTIPAPIKIGCSTRWRRSDLQSFIEAA